MLAAKPARCAPTLSGTAVLKSAAVAKLLGKFKVDSRESISAIGLDFLHHAQHLQKPIILLIHTPLKICHNGYEDSQGWVEHDAQGRL